ncbi:hypothetical protein ACIQHV_12450 [Bacillus bombysepticus]|uniref:Uncharacterized protein n=1 Tax=Bacillus thuringiensis serovar kumamotoensis TaxID=132267 RepID=A0A9X6JHU3_BACUK|nr:hypothetical protein [Bacillus thuringiensis]MEC2869301.1 hypothetical protein [Bacillus cereus]OTZ65783.1 hypothetical protein BK769_34370 [Bacillus thuringiensis serovar kumamtoensis]
MIDVDIQEHIKDIDVTLKLLRRDRLDRTDSYCSLMQAKSIALLAVSSNNSLRKEIAKGDEHVTEDM